jgi:hypothetical protein
MITRQKVEEFPGLQDILRGRGRHAKHPLS